MMRLKGDAACEPAAVGLPSTRLKAYNTIHSTEPTEAEQTECKHVSVYLGSLVLKWASH